MTATIFNDAQWEKINSQASFAKEQDQLEKIRISHTARVESENGQKLGLELLCNQVWGIFNPDKEMQEEDCQLQAALSAQVSKTDYENRGAASQNRTNPRKNSESRSPNSGSQDIQKLTRIVIDMKAEMGSMRKATIRSCTSFDKSPNQQPPREPPANGKEKNNFAGTAKKKNRKDKVAQRSLVPVETKESVNGPINDNQLEFGGVATVMKPQKYVSPRSINAQPLITGMQRQDIDTSGEAMRARRPWIAEKALMKSKHVS